MPSSNHYAGMPLDRDDALRRDEAAVARLRDDARSRVLPLWRYQHLVSGAERPEPVWQTGARARELLSGARPWVLLGRADGVAHFAVDVSDLEAPEREGPFVGHGRFVDLRAIGPLLERRAGSIMAYARGLI